MGMSQMDKSKIHVKVWQR